MTERTESHADFLQNEHTQKLHEAAKKRRDASLILLLRACAESQDPNVIRTHAAFTHFDNVERLLATGDVERAGGARDVVSNAQLGMSQSKT